MEFIITDTPNPVDVQAIRSGLAAYNVAKVPELLDLPDGEFTVVLRDDNGDIRGGAYCEFDWGWLFVDTIWVADSARGKGYGRQLLQAAESYAAAQGVKQAYLFTVDFQAKPFYEKAGYRVFGTLDDRPKGHANYYFSKQGLIEQPQDAVIELQTPPNPADLKILDTGLRTHAAQHVPLAMHKLAITLRDDDTIVGGLSGSSYWDWFDLRFFWVDESLRGMGYGKQLLDMLEDVCHERNLTGILCDTASFQALPFYNKHGFKFFGILGNRPPKHSSYYLKKIL